MNTQIYLVAFLGLGSVIAKAWWNSLLKGSDEIAFYNTSDVYQHLKNRLGAIAVFPVDLVKNWKSLPKKPVLPFFTSAEFSYLSKMSKRNTFE